MWQHCGHVTVALPVPSAVLALIVSVRGEEIYPDTKQWSSLNIKNITNITKYHKTWGKNSSRCSPVPGYGPMVLVSPKNATATDKEKNIWKHQHHCSRRSVRLIILYLIFPPWSVKVSKNIKFPSGNDEIKVTWHLIASTGRERLANTDIATTCLIVVWL